MNSSILPKHVNKHCQVFSHHHVLDLYQHQTEHCSTVSGPVPFATLGNTFGLYSIVPVEESSGSVEVLKAWHEIWRGGGAGGVGLGGGDRNSPCSPSQTLFPPCLGKNVRALWTTVRQTDVLWLKPDNHKRFVFLPASVVYLLIINMHIILHDHIQQLAY